MYRVGIDTGGTNTDVVLMDAATGEYVVTKVPTTPAAPMEGIFSGLERACRQTGLELKDLDHLIYATTLVVNIVAQHQQVPVALMTTEGFRDVLEIGRAFRAANIYDIQMERPEPLVPREFRFGIRERVDFRGRVLITLDEEQVVVVARQIRAAGLQTVAVSLFHAYRNPVHEKRIRDILAAECPGVYVSLSSDVNPQFREFERTSTTVINAFVMPALKEHLVEFSAEMQRATMATKPFMMQANAGVMSFRFAGERPVQVANSGPIAGIVAATFLSRDAGYANLITMDMGGTSCDVGLISGGEMSVTDRSQVRGYPVSIPTVDVHYIGAGGGSIAMVDSGGALQVGPQSAGARPGPACYRLGGTQPTVTDANLLAARLNAEGFLDGSFTLDREAARHAVDPLARQLGMPGDELVEGIIDVAVSNMMRAVKLISIERGYDPRDFALLAFGGAGPLHAALLARELEIPRVLIPSSPGTFSALGTVLADIRYDYVTTNVHELGEQQSSRLQDLFAGLVALGERQLESEGVDPADRVFAASCDLRYAGQGWELPVPVALPLQGQHDLDSLRQQFHATHARAYGHDMPDQPVEVVNLRVAAVGRTPRPVSRRLRVERESVAVLGKRTVKLWRREVACLVLQRDGLAPGAVYRGPAIVEEMGATTLVLPDQVLGVDVAGNLVLERAEVAANVVPERVEVGPRAG